MAKGKGKSENTPEDLDARLLAQMLEDFLEESCELLDDLNTALTELEKNTDDAELINRIFHCMIPEPCHHRYKITHPYLY